MASAPEELDPQLALEVAYLLRQRGPREIESARGATNVHLISHRHEIAPVPQFHRQYLERIATSRIMYWTTRTAAR